MFERIKGEIPNAETLVQWAVEARIGQRNDVESFIRGNFSSLVEELQVDAYKLYLECEQHSASSIIRKSVAERLPAGSGADNALDVIAGSFGELDKFFLSLTQSRRALAGTAFQEIMSILLKKLGYPFVAQPVLDDSKPDYVMPSREWYEAYAADCILICVNRGLKQILQHRILERRNRPPIFLMFDGGVPQITDLAKLGRINLWLVVTKRCKNIFYAEHHTVITFEWFIEHYLQPAMRRWREVGKLSAAKPGPVNAYENCC